MRLPFFDRDPLAREFITLTARADGIPGRGIQPGATPG
jgi:hypothetical protein